MKKHKKLFLTLVTLLSGLCMVFTAISPALALTVNYNDLISDSLFDNDNTMTASQINTFLNGFSDSCISTNKGFTAPDVTGYNPTDGFLYGGNTSAGQVIYDAAQAYNINPEVLLATIQKEQSLVTGTGGCGTLAYAAALGYNCPDGGTTYSYSGVDLYSINGHETSSVSGTCVDDKLAVGFSQQIIHAAWLLKFDRERAEGNLSWAIISGSWDNSDDLSTCYSGYMVQGTYAICPSGSSTYYSGQATIDGTAVTISNGATAALYDYTPHLSGNSNFVTIFTDWFGSTDVSNVAYAWTLSGQAAYDGSGDTDPFTDGSEGIDIAPGQTAYLVVTATNNGYKPWSPSTVHLGTTDPQDAASKFANGTWLSSNRVAMTNTNPVLPGQTATFSFSITAPSTTGTYEQHLSLVADGLAWMNNPGMYYTINVVNPDPASSTATLLNGGQSIDVGHDMLSPDGQSRLVPQSDGNLVLYDNFAAVWSSQTGGQSIGNGELTMETTGNLVFSSSTGKEIWESNTSGNPGAYLALQSDDNLVIYTASKQPIWASDTVSVPINTDRVNTTIDSGFSMWQGQMLETANRQYYVIMQTDGNLVLYDSSNKPLWASNTAGSGAEYADMQTDGNLVLYTASGKAVWASKTNGKGDSYLIMQADGNLVEYQDGTNKPIWASGTAGRT